MRRAICMPVGPVGITPETALCCAALVRLGVVEAWIMGGGPHVPARNEAWGKALSLGVERVLWLDADCWAQTEDFVTWIRHWDRRFASDAEREKLVVEGLAPGELQEDGAGVDVGWIAPVVARRGGGWAFMPPRAVEINGESEDVPLLAGLGIGYWHVERVTAALRRASLPEHCPFAWQPPFSEDTGMSLVLAWHGCRTVLDPTLPTSHVGVGSWRGGSQPPTLPGVAP